MSTALSDEGHKVTLSLYAPNAIWLYAGMAIAGFDIPIRDDAPLGMTTIGSNLGNLWGRYGGWGIGVIPMDDPYAVQVDVMTSGPTLDPGG